MKKIVPFKKDIIFEDSIFEVASIALEHTLDVTAPLEVTGNFTIDGTYKVTESSTTCKEFSYTLPFEIHLDDKYDLKNVKISIDDFYYEIVNNKVLMIRIEVLLDELEEKERKEIMEENIVENEVEETEEENERCIEEEAPVVSSITSEEIYQSYKVYIVREGDTLESILTKYNVTKEQLDDYNDLSNLEINSKILIPCSYETNS